MFHAERVEVKDKAYHKKCASCFNCSKPLSSRDLCEGSDGNIFCSSCYSRKFGAPGYRGGYLRMYFSERRSISSVWRFAYAGAGCGEWTDAASAEALRPCQNLDVSTIKGEEGGENTCKKCEGKVMMIGYWIFCRQKFWSPLFCLLQIFDTERIASKSFTFHRKCFCCVKCGNALGAGTLHYAFEGPDQELYCKVCFKKNYPNTEMPKIYSDTTVIKPADGGENACPRCEGAVFQVQTTALTANSITNSVYASFFL